jgi:hypothetical protein
VRAAGLIPILQFAGSAVRQFGSDPRSSVRAMNVLIRR